MNEIDRFIILLVAASVVLVVAQWIRLSPTLALLLLGLGLGAFTFVPEINLSSDVILLIFLPPLLFEAAFVLNLRLLWEERVGVFVLALPGVLLAMAVTGALVHWVIGLDWTFALLFGAIVAATDPVAVLATFRELGADQRLTTLIEGESLFNDAVALALLVTLVDSVDGGYHFGSATGRFVWSAVGGAVIGVTLGWFAHFLIASVDQHLTEMSVSVAVAYGSFLASEQVHASGVLATIAAAMTLGHLGRSRGWVFSEDSEELLEDLWEFLAFVANAALFLLMGFAVHASGLRNHPEDVLIGIVAALAGRAAVAYGLGAALEPLGFPVAWAERHILFLGGLRGAVAVAAALSLDSDFPHRDQLLAMTYGVVLFTLLAQGLTIAPIGRRLGVLGGTASPASTDDRARVSVAVSEPTE